MSNHTEKIIPTPTLNAIIRNVKDIDNIDRLPCPRCSGQMERIDNGCYPFEEYKANGTFERTERYYCENEDCCTWANVTQVYKPSDRRMKVIRDVFDEEE